MPSSWDVINLDGLAITGQEPLLPAAAVCDAQHWDKQEPVLRRIANGVPALLAADQHVRVQTPMQVERRLAMRHRLRMELACVYRRWRAR